MLTASAIEANIRQLFKDGQVGTIRLCTIIVICYTVLWLTYILFYSYHRKIPGPFLARITKLWEVKKVIDGNIHKTMIQLHKQYGPVVRIAPNRYDFNTLEAAKIIYRISNAMPKSKYYIPFGSPHGTNLLNTLLNAEHSAMKRQFASLYSMSTLLSYESAVNSQTHIMREKLDAFASSGNLVDIPSFFQYYAFDVIGMITLGSSMGMMNANADLMGACAALDTTWNFVSVLGLLPAIYPWLMSTLALFRVSRPTDGLENFIERQLALHRAEAAQTDGTKKAATFLSKMLTLQKEGKATDVEVRRCIEMNIGAGSDTTAISLSSILYYLYTNPRVLERLRHELDSRSKSGRLSDMPTYHETQDIPYLQAVIKETLRLHSAVGTQLTRVVPRGGVVIEGHYFHEGAEVGVNSWALHYNKEMFGHDAHAFRPERWLESDKANVGLPDSFAFGQGSRTCIGKNISILEMSKAIPQVVRSFDLDFTASTKTWSTECRWFVKPSYNARIRHRAVFDN